MRKIYLFCLPFAGGSKSAYHQFMKLAPDYLEVIPVELPGRGSRYREPLLTSLHSMADDILRQIRKYLVYPYAIYGHSMGALLSYLVTHRINSENLDAPLHLFLTGREGPSMPARKRKFHLLDTPGLVTELRIMGGIPEEILGDEKLLDLFLPIIRADFRATETFEYIEREKLNVPITVITGSEENITPEKAEAWKIETSALTDIRRLPGNHFFIFNYSAEVMELITRTICTRMNVLS